MALPSSMAIALKEWATVCHALETGRQMLLLRKAHLGEVSVTVWPEVRKEMSRRHGIQVIE